MVTVRLPRSGAGLLSLALVVILIMMMVVVWLQVARTLRSAKPPPVTAQPTSLVWGDRVFQTEPQLQRWVEGRGLNYATWAAKHRGAIAVIEHRPAVRTSAAHVPTPAKSKAVAAPKPHKAPAKKASPAKASSPAKKKAVPAKSAAPATTAVSAKPPSDGPLIGIGWALALILATVAFLPRRLVARVYPREFGMESRTAVAAAALAVGFGLLVAGAAI